MTISDGKAVIERGLILTDQVKPEDEEYHYPIKQLPSSLWPARGNITKIEEYLWQGQSDEY